MFETERLFLRKMTADDLDSIYAMRSDADVMRYIREPQKRNEALNWIKLVSSRWEKDKIGFCSVFLKSTNQFVGWCGLWQLKETGEIEVGYALCKEFWGRGFAVEASKSFLEYGFTKLNLLKIVACANPDNKNSRRVMEKLGMKFDHIGVYYGTDLVHYSITKEKFLTQRRKEAKAQG
jgi:[ribosomal protein S5]-alanine N-acetyltransferase